ncbi:MAG: SPASM domain-containing protein [Phycisphaerae bacterium]
MPEFVKTRDNFADLEAFYDRWMQSLGTAVIAGASAFGGRRSDRRVTRVTPPGRTPCRQVFRRALLLADGRLASCDQDYRGEVSVSTEPESGLAAWTGGRMKALRCAQRDQSLGGWPLCGACEEWHRP